MIKTICDKCNDFGWVCENHPDQEAFECKYCKGAGMPCECHQLNLAKNNLHNKFIALVKKILKKASEK